MRHGVAIRGERTGFITIFHISLYCGVRPAEQAWVRFTLKSARRKAAREQARADALPAHLSPKYHANTKHVY